MDVKSIEMPGRFTTVKIDTDIRDRLAKYGRYGESMSDIIGRILQEWEKSKK